MLCPEYFWQYYSPDSLALTIAQNPLTQERVKNFLENSISGVIFVKSTNPRFFGEIQPVGAKFVISITIHPPRYARELTFVHEIVHGIFRAGDWNNSNPQSSAEVMEDLIEKEAKRFYDSNLIFIKKMYAKYEQISGA